MNNKTKRKKRTLGTLFLRGGIGAALILVLLGVIGLISDLHEGNDPFAVPESSSISVTEETLPTGDLSPVLLERDAEIPEWLGQASADLNGGEPCFSESEKAGMEPFEAYSPLDSMGRCGITFACLDRSLMPGEERGDISQVHPTGWKSGMGWERCHLLGYQLTGENDNERNLITGSHYFNVTAMLPWENRVAKYIRNTGNRVLYRVTPIYREGEPIAAGVEMEAWSVEDAGEGICFHVFAFNVEPGFLIDYSTGDVRRNGTRPTDTVYLSKNQRVHTDPHCSGMQNAAELTVAEAEELGYHPCNHCGIQPESVTIQNATQPGDTVYISKRGKIHTKPNCSGMQNAAEMTLEEAEAQGYESCPMCGPNQEERK